MSGDRVAKECIQMVLEADIANEFHSTNFEEPLDYNSMDASGETSESDADADPWMFSYLLRPEFPKEDARSKA